MLSKIKKIHYIYGLLTIALLFSASLLVYFNNKPKEEPKKPQEQSYVLDSNLLPVDIDGKRFPIMWDFVHGTLGYKWDYKEESLSNFYAIMINNKYLGKDVDKATFFVSGYFPAQYMPGVGDGPAELTLEGNEWELFRSRLEDIKNRDKSFIEREYTCREIGRASCRERV